MFVDNVTVVDYVINKQGYSTFDTQARLPISMGIEL